MEPLNILKSRSKQAEIRSYDLEMNINVFMYLVVL